MDSTRENCGAAIDSEGLDGRDHEKLSVALCPELCSVCIQWMRRQFRGRPCRLTEECNGQKYSALVWCVLDVD